MGEITTIISSYDVPMCPMMKGMQKLFGINLGLRKKSVEYNPTTNFGKEIIIQKLKYNAL